MVRHSFFLSHLRGQQHDAFLDKFYDDLVEAVRSRLRVRPAPEAQIGFYDHRLPLGADWNPGLAEGLQSSDTFIALFGPAYFGSEYCGKEYMLFRQRMDALRRVGLGLDETAGDPPLIKPVVWMPFDARAVPPIAARAQYVQGSADDPVPRLGLRRVIKQLNVYKTAYDDFVENLATDIVADSERYGARLPRVAAATLSQVPSAFGGVGAGRFGDLRAGGPASGPKRVKYVFVAARPEEVAAIPGSLPDAYRDEGGCDWKPFFPARDLPIRALAQSVASEDTLRFFSDELSFSGDLVAQIREAERQRNIVVLIVDPWTTALGSYRDQLLAFDQQNYFNTTVVVPRIAADEPRRAQLTASVARAMPFRSSLSNLLYFNAAIGSEEELRAWLREVLTRLKAEIVLRASVERALPEGGSKPIVSGPGALL